jgi:two-component system chemotaxis sensor kinase CheA
MAVDALIDSVRNVVMLPFSSLLETFPKIVRDLARDKEINVEFHVSGADIEIDRRILDEMKDPFIHLIRNSIDHGIETPEIRASRKKSPAGSISISVNRIEGNKAEILFSDDGNGIDEEKVRLAARKAGHITASDEKEESNENFSTLLFLSGVSTSEFVTDLSGRGLGLAIVRENIEKLGGSVDVTDTRCGVGTTFRMVIPLTRATFRGIRIRVSENEFIVPVSAVEHVFSADEEDLFFVKGKRVINYGDISMQLISLGDIFMLPCKKDESTKINILVVSSGTLKVAMAVQEVMDEEEVLVRSMDVRLASVRYFNGAAVLGSGRVIPVIDVSAIIKTASAKKNIPVPQEIGPPTPADEQKSVLVVEDSITSRMLLKNILESAGFKVVTANDGIDGFSKLPGHSIDLVVSDVDMPRMNGFDLTAKIKTDKRYAEIPVVLVTALESSEDKKHGIDVGADAYIIKSSFDQSNLIEVIERLV